MGYGMTPEAFIIEGVVSVERTKEVAIRKFEATGQRTRIHFHSANSGVCNDRCTEWPLTSG